MSTTTPSPDEPMIVAAGAGATPSRRAGAVALPHPRVVPYLVAARGALSDLPPGEQDELLEDLDAHLHEILAEEGEAFEARLGPADAYAAELRASAGYPRPADRAPRGLPPRAERVAVRVRSIRREAAGLLDALPGARAAVGYLRRLRPAWWLLRGWMAAYLIVGDSLLGYFGFGGLRPFAAMVVCIAVSVIWGLSAERRGSAVPVIERIVLLGLNTAAVLVILSAISGSGPMAQVGSAGAADPIYVSEAVPGLAMDGEPISNLAAYTIAGEPIDAFQLFDQDGRPVVVAPDGADGYTVPVTSPDGEPVDNVFPLRRVEITVSQPLSCDPPDPMGACSATGEVVGQRPMPPASPRQGLIAAPVPAPGSSIPFDEQLQPLWPAPQPPPAVPSP